MRPHLKSILLGFQVGTGEPVHIDPDHLIVTGQTRVAGKTETLNALVYRSRRRAIAFRTKRGEMTFDAAGTLKPFYREPRKSNSRFIDRRYVKSILEASESRGLNFEEAWIIRACEGARTLRDVYDNIVRLQREARRGIDENQYLKLRRYFEDILPQLEEREYATTISLVQGINVMDLEMLSHEMKCLVMERTIAYVMERMRDVIVLLPEGWKYVPEKTTTPVKAAAIAMGREGASLGNHVWVDSQDLRGVDKELVGQCTTWLMGVQVEENEARRTRESLGRRVSVADIQGLRRGHFYLRTKMNELTHVYVLPADVPEEMGRHVALGELDPEAVKDYLAKMRAGKEDGDEEMYRELCEKTQHDLEKVQSDKEALELQLKELQEHKLNDEELQQLRQRVTELEGLRDRQASEIQALGEKAKRFEGVDIDKLNEMIGSLQEELKDYTRLRSVMTDFLRINDTQVIERPTPASVDMGEVAVLVDERLAQVLREAPPGRVVSFSVSDAARELIREGFARDMAEKITGLTPEPRRIALTVREHGTIKSGDLYALIRGKGKVGRLPVNFNTAIKRLEDVGLVTRNPSTGLVSWGLRDCIDGRLIDLADEETRRQLEEYLASLLLPGSAETR
jgi:hypothetical protein